MPPNNPMSAVTFGHLTEACPQMRRRFRPGAAVEVATWLAMMHNRFARQLKAMPEPSDPETEAYHAGTAHYLLAQMRLINSLIESVPLKFRTLEWDVAVEQMQAAMESAAQGQQTVRQTDPQTDSILQTGE